MQEAMWEFRPGTSEPLKHRMTGEVRSLKNSESRLLLLLLTHSHRTVTKDEIHNFAWPGKVVSDDSITRAISTLRTALGDSAAQQKIIRTAPKSGYFIIGNHVVLIEETPQATIKPVSSRTQKNKLRVGLLLTCLGFILVNVFLFNFLFMPSGNSDQYMLSRIISGNTQFMVESDDLVSLELMSNLSHKKRSQPVDFYITSNQARIYVSCVLRTPEAKRRNSLNFSIDIDNPLEYISNEIHQQCQ
ncbi:winged helix-turn-helix domain-containing protein [Photobacterium sanguinicancri]|uniref:winged helix-turn-helix domain-containing protein n=1 Tax=Photobacterium sanguinicancri TaxID=875932 RepID=UPI00247FC7D2|nr:winged helix-turn-helix domain-containing protein [Photobacterium sanguinicancri]